MTSNIPQANAARCLQDWAPQSPAVTSHCSAYMLGSHSLRHDEDCLLDKQCQKRRIQISLNPKPKLDLCSFLFLDFKLDLFCFPFVNMSLAHSSGVAKLQSPSIARSQARRRKCVVCNAGSQEGIGKPSAFNNLLGVHANVWCGVWTREDAVRAIEGTKRAGFDLIEGNWEKLI